jgi:hypothetical protein
MTEETPSVHRLNAACCDAHIINFDLPSNANRRLEKRARQEGWTQNADDTWTCRQHRT